ncbi:Bifunctional protein Aas [compost metagenome]
MVRTILRALARLVYRVRVEQPENAAAPSKCLIVANHQSLLDGLILWLFLPVNATFVVHTTVKAHWLYGRLLRFVPHLAVAANDPMALKQVVRLVDSGTPVVIFPEGRLTTTGSLMKIYEGSAYVAVKTQAAVVPVRIEGLLRSRASRVQHLYKPHLLPRVTVRVLPPTHLEVPAEGSARVKRQRAGVALRRLMQGAAVAARTDSTLYEEFLARVRDFGRGYPLLQDVQTLTDPTQPAHTYGSLLKMSLAMQRIVSRVSSVDEPVGVLMPNAAPTVGLVLALSAARRVPAMLNYTAGLEGMQAACVAAQVRTVITSRAFLDKAKLTQTVAGLQGVRVLYLEDLRTQFGLADRLWVAAHLLAPRRAVVQQSPEAPAVILFTSGSEGKPKGVVHSHRSILANVAQVQAVADFNPSDRFLVALPLFHSFGFTCGTMLPLLAGSSIMLYPSPLHYRIIPEVAYDRNCTVLFGTSTFLANYARFAHPYDFHRLRYVVAGAEKLSSAVRETWFEKFGIRVMEGYGSTECAPVLAVNTPMAFRSGSVGQFVPGVRHRLQPVPGVEQGGLLEVQGPNLMAGYLRYERPGVLEAPQASDEPGWYSTGDVVELDADGFVFIKGRVKRFAKIAGEMVSLEAVEALATRASSGFVHAAVAIPHEGKGEAIVLFTTDTSLAREQLSQAAKEMGLPELAVPRTIRHLEAIPVLGTGKTDYVSLGRLALTP